MMGDNRIFNCYLNYQYTEMQRGPTYDLEVSHLADHGVGVHLTHVIAAVLLMSATHMQQPRLLVVMGHAEPWHSCDHVAMNREDHLSINMDPRYLSGKSYGH
jgi:hypothetical protein